MADQSLDEVLVKIKVDLDSFRKSFADAKKIAEQGMKDIENTLNNSSSFKNAGKNAGNSFVQGFNESLRNIKSKTDSTVSEVNKSLGNIGKNSKDVNVKVNADTSGIGNAGNMISGLGTMLTANSLGSFNNTITRNNGIQELRKYTGDVIKYIDKLNNQETTAGSFENTKKITDNILENLKRIKDGGWFNIGYDSSELEDLMSQLKVARENAEKIKVNPITKNSSNQPNAPNQTTNRTQPNPLEGWDGDINAFANGITNALSGVDDSARRSQVALEDYMDTFNKLPAAQQRVVEEASLLKAAMTLPQDTEGGIAFLRTLDSIDKKYKGTLSSIKAEDLGKILNDKFKFALDPSIFQGMGNNITQALKTIDRDSGIAAVTGNIKSIADEAELSASRIERAMQQAGMSINAFNSASTQQGQSASQTSATVTNIQQTMSLIDRLKAKIKELDIKGLGQQTFGSFKNKIYECVPGLESLTKKIKEVFNQKDKTTGKAIGNLGDKAEKSSSKIKGLISKLAGLFGLYKLGQILKDGTNDAIRYEASMMGIEKRLGSASNILKTFAENEAVSFGLKI